MQQTHPRNGMGGWVQVGVVALACFIGAGTATEVRGESTEIRDFVVQLDGKQIGTNQLVITRRDDGLTVVSNRANVKVKFFITYTYTYQGTEVYKGYQLTRMEGHCNDNGTQFRLDAELDDTGNTFRVQVNNSVKAVPANIWSTSYWKLPEAKYHNQPVVMLDADRGEVINGKLHYVGTEDRPISGQVQKCYHFRATGGKKPIDLWFDVQHRLVRQEFVERGHRTVIELTQIQRTGK